MLSFQGFLSSTCFDFLKTTSSKLGWNLDVFMPEQSSKVLKFHDLEIFLHLNEAPENVVKSRTV